MSTEFDETVAALHRFQRNTCVGTVDDALLELFASSSPEHRLAIQMLAAIAAAGYSVVKASDIPHK